MAVFTFVALNLSFFVFSLTFGSGLKDRFFLFDFSLDLSQCVSEDIIIALERKIGIGNDELFCLLNLLLN